MAGGEAGESLDAAWERLEAQIDLAEGFWLGFVFCSSPQAVAELRERAKRRLRDVGKGLLLLATEEPHWLGSTLRELLDDDGLLADISSGCSWVEAIRSDSPGVAEQPWRRAWEKLFLRANEHRDALRARLKGGLVFAAAPEIKSVVREAAPDLWSVRSIVIDLKGREDVAAGMSPPARSDPARSPDPKRIESKPGAPLKLPGRPPGMPFLDDMPLLPSPPTPPPSTPPPWIADKGASVYTVHGVGIGQSLLQSAAEFLAEGRIDRAREAASEARTFLRGKDVLAESRALSILALISEACGALATAEEYIKSAISCRRSVAPDEMPMDWVALAARLAAQRGDTIDAEMLYSEAEVFCRRSVLRKETIKGLSDLLFVVSGRGDLLYERSALAAAATAFDEAVVLARRLCDLCGDLPDALGELSTALIKLADVRVDRGDIAGGASAFEEAVSVSRRLSVLGGESPDGMRQLSVALARAGRLRREAGDLQSARAAMEEALSIRRSLVERDPGPQRLRDLASCLHHVGELEVAAGDLMAATRAYEEALTLDRQRHSELPDTPDVIRDLALSLFRAGDVQRRSGNSASAEAALQECINLTRRLDGRDPQSRRLLDAALRVLAEVKRAAGDEAGAQALEQSLAALSKPSGASSTDT